MTDPTNLLIPGLPFFELAVFGTIVVCALAVVFYLALERAIFGGLCARWPVTRREPSRESLADAFEGQGR